MLNAAILFVAVYFLLFKPVSRILKARREAVMKEVEDARALRAQADAALAEGEAKRDESFAEAIDRAVKIQEQAKEQGERIVVAAKREASAIIETARREAEEMTGNSSEAMRDFAASLAVDISAKILGREITDGDHQRLIDEFLKEVK